MPSHGHAWRRGVAALLAAVIAFYGVIALGGVGTAFADPEICRSQPANGDADAGDKGHDLRLCLLCLPGCSSLAAADAVFLAAPWLRLAAPADALAIEAIRAEQRPEAHRPRGPPA